MKTALILGISGGFGGYVAQALAQNGYALKALMRDPAKLPARFKNVEVVAGDVSDPEKVRAAMHGVDLVVYGVNPPGYDWEGKALPWLENVARVAEAQKLCIVFPANVYVLDPKDGPEFDESARLHPVSSLGRIRQAMEARLQQAAQNGARVIVIRMGDYIGKHAPSTWIHHLIKRTKKGYTVALPGPRELQHTWAYLPDAAQTVAQLVEKQHEMPAFSVLHFKGFRITFNDIAQAISQQTGKPVTFKSFPWWALRMMAPFSVMYRGLVEMRYLWKEEINLSDRKLVEVLGPNVPATPLGQALREAGVIVDEHHAEESPPAGFALRK